MSKKTVIANQIPLGDNSADHSDDEIELKPTPVMVTPVEQPVKEKKEKKKRNISEEQKAILIERLKTAHARKAELTEARRKVKEEEESNHLAKKQLAILEQARLIKQRQKKELDAVTITPSGDKPKKTPKVKYIYESESESEDEIVVVKKKKSPKKSEPVPPPPQPVQAVQEPQPAFKIKFF